MRKVTITGTGGVQQTSVAAAFAAAGWTVTGTRRQDKGPNLESGARLVAAFADSDAVVFTVPRGPVARRDDGHGAARASRGGDRIAELYGALDDNPDAMADGHQGMARLGVAAESLADFTARQTWA